MKDNTVKRKLQIWCAVIPTFENDDYSVSQNIVHLFVQCLYISIIWQT